MNDPVTFSAIVGALASAIGVLWKKLAVDHAKLEKRAEALEAKDEARDKDMAQVSQVLAIYRACPAQPCPAVEGLKRAAEENFNVKPHLKPTPKK